MGCCSSTQPEASRAVALQTQTSMPVTPSEPAVTVMPVVIQSTTTTAGIAPARPKLERAAADTGVSQRRLATKEEMPSVNPDHVNNIRGKLDRAPPSKRNLAQQGHVNQSSKRLGEFVNAQTEEAEAELEWDAAKGKFVMKTQDGEVKDESVDVSKLREGGQGDLVWDPDKKKFVVAKTQPKPESQPVQQAQPGVEVAKRPIHSNIFCDSCQRSKELLLLSVLMGACDPETLFIVGVRYHSAYVQNFDLCEVCEKVGHLAEAGPFLKIETPQKAPIQAKVVVAEINDPELMPRPGFTIHIGVTCDGCKRSEQLKLLSMQCGRNIQDTIIGTRFKSAVVDNFDLCEVCEASGIFDDLCGPYLKLEKPSLVPLLMTIWPDGRAIAVQ